MLRFPKWAQNLSSGAKNLLGKLLMVTPEARITAKQALEHPWVMGVSAAADNFLESPRTLRRLSMSKGSSCKQEGEGEKSALVGVDKAEQMEVEGEAVDVESKRRADFEAQTNDYSDAEVEPVVAWPRKNSV